MLWIQEVTERARMMSDDILALIAVGDSLPVGYDEDCVLTLSMEDPDDRFLMALASVSLEMDKQFEPEIQKLKDRLPYGQIISDENEARGLMGMMESQQGAARMIFWVSLQEKYGLWTCGPLAFRRGWQIHFCEMSVPMCVRILHN